MFRKPDGKIGFSSTGFFNDLPGSLASSSGADPGHISSPQQDSIYVYQLQCPNPCALTNETLYVSQIIDTEKNSTKAFKQLQKLGLVNTSDEVDTAAFDNPKFGKELTSSLAFIPVSRQKQIVDFLFWWDDETKRLKKLMEERRELQSMIENAEDSAHRDKLKLLLDRVQLKISMRPSERVAEMEGDEDLEGLIATADGTGMNTGGSGSVAPPAYR